MCPTSPPDYRYEPQLEIVVPEPVPSKQDQENTFWEKNATVPIEELMKRKKKTVPN
jgi:hypothetical protein